MADRRKKDTHIESVPWDSTGSSETGKQRQSRVLSSQKMEATADSSPSSPPCRPRLQSQAHTRNRRSVEITAQHPNTKTQLSQTTVTAEYNRRETDETGERERRNPANWKSVIQCNPHIQFHFYCAHCCRIIIRHNNMKETERKRNCLTIRIKTSGKLRTYPWGEYTVSPSHATQLCLVQREGLGSCSVIGAMKAGLFHWMLCVGVLESTEDQYCWWRNNLAPLPPCSPWPPERRLTLRDITHKQHRQD